jgi:hypothetical protein
MPALPLSSRLPAGLVPPPHACQDVTSGGRGGGVPAYGGPTADVSLPARHGSLRLAPISNPPRPHHNHARRSPAGYSLHDLRRGHGLESALTSLPQLRSMNVQRATTRKPTFKKKGR